MFVVFTFYPRSSNELYCILHTHTFTFLFFLSKKLQFENQCLCLKVKASQRAVIMFRVEMSVLYSDFSGPGALSRGEHKSCNHNNLVFVVRGAID